MQIDRFLLLLNSLIDERLFDLSIYIQKMVSKGLLLNSDSSDKHRYLLQGMVVYRVASNENQMKQRNILLNGVEREDTTLRIIDQIRNCLLLNGLESFLEKATTSQLSAAAMKHLAFYLYSYLRGSRMEINSSMWTGSFQRFMLDLESLKEFSYLFKVHQASLMSTLTNTNFIDSFEALGEIQQVQ